MTIKLEQTDIGVDDWIDGATFIQVKVDIHRNPALWADLAPLYAQIDAAEQRVAALRGAAARTATDDESSLGERAGTPTAPAGEESLGEATHVPATVAGAQADLDELVQRAEELYARFDADKETWTLRGLDTDEVQAITDAVRADLGHGAAPVRRAKETAKKYAERVQAWQQGLAGVKDEVDVRAVQAAVVKVVVAGVEKPAPSVDGIRRLRQRPHGERHFRELVTALEAVTLQEVAIPAPHRRGA